MRVKKWREDAQPEWAGSASGAQALPATGGDTRAFPEPGATGVPDGAFRAFGDAAFGEPASGAPASGDADATQALRGGPGAHPHADAFARTDAFPHAAHADAFARTDAFPHAAHADADHTAVLPSSARPGTGPAAPRDPWQTPGDTEHTHDPHEVTVQLDAVSLQQDMGLRRAKGGAAGGDGSDRPVFVDESGRRSRRFRRIGVAIGLACAVYAVVIVMTLLSGSSDAPWLPVPGQKDEQPADEVDTSPQPSGTADPSGTAGASPGASATTTDGATASPGAAGVTPGASGGAGQGASADPQPSASTSTSKPGTGVSPPVPSLSADPVTPSAGPSTGGSTTAAPSESPVGDTTGLGNGTGAVAAGPSTPTPVAEEPGTPALPSTSPEYHL
ncbi:hypothetical protein ACH4ZX_24985 [Streptomyces sp. NPDC020490]|uniref:hypothetical protein n=1 Tax=Streptomyces sp. NPDC020490 TaxID=3365078 RepID=UPI0037B6067C